MDKEIKRLYKDKGFKNPSAIVSCLYMVGFKGRFTELRKKVIKEIQRLNRRNYFISIKS